MMPTGTAKIGQRIRTPDGVGVVRKVYDQDNVQVELEGKVITMKDGGLSPVLWKGDQGECDAFCNDCRGFHTFNKHTAKQEEVKIGV